MKYILKEDKGKEIREKYKIKFFVENVGISRCYTSLILNRRKSCPKVVAYSITKILDSEAEISDFFEVEKNGKKENV